MFRHKKIKVHQNLPFRKSVPMLVLSVLILDLSFPHGTDTNNEAEVSERQNSELSNNEPAEIPSLMLVLAGGTPFLHGKILRNAPPLSSSVSFR
jgi:hypothetical protein